MNDIADRNVNGKSLSGVPTRPLTWIFESSYVYKLG